MAPFRVALVYTDEGVPVPPLVREALAAAKPVDIRLEVSSCIDPERNFAEGQPPLLTQAVAEAAREADALWVFGGAKLSPDVLSLLPKLKAIIRSGSGTDNIPTAECTAAGVLVVNTPRATVHPVSDHAIALLFSLTRQVPQHTALTRAGVWDRNAAPTPFELIGTTLGFCGFGAIPRMMLRKLQHFEQSYLVFDPMLEQSDVDAELTEQGITASVQLVATLEELCSRSDIISVHAPLTPATVGLVGEDCFRAMKPTGAQSSPVRTRGFIMFALTLRPLWCTPIDSSVCAMRWLHAQLCLSTQLAVSPFA